MIDALTFMKTYGFNPSNCNHLSTFDEPQPEDDADSGETALYLTKLTVISVNFFFLSRFVCKAFSLRKRIKLRF
jgi:hypothetical protein